MLPVNIDIRDFISHFQLTIDETELFVYGLLDEIGERFKDGLIQNADRELKQVRQEYIRSIYIEKPDPETLIVGLSGWLPNAVEKGLQPFDMKEGFSKSDKRKPAYRKNRRTGWYLTIPFRIGIPSTIGDSSIFSNIMPEKVYEVAKEKLKTNSDRLRETDLPPEFQIKGVRSEVTNNITNQVFPSYTHKSSIYEGMQRSPKEFHSQYVTFRRVSDLSDPNSWIHSGIVAHNLMEKTLNSFPIGDIVSNTKKKFLETR